MFCAIAEGLASVLTVVLQQSVCPFPQSFDVTMSCCDNEPHAPSQGEHHAVCLGLCQSSGATPIHTSAIHTKAVMGTAENVEDFPLCLDVYFKKTVVHMPGQ